MHQTNSLSSLSMSISAIVRDRERGGRELIFSTGAIQKHSFQQAERLKNRRTSLPSWIVEIDHRSSIQDPKSLSMDTAQWPQQGIGVAKGVERRARPYKEQALNCPRCNSTNTKFCYYNNYSLSQPRYFCKTCRRYWTEGGSLRNVPVGGGSRKNKRSSSSSSSAASSLSSPSIPAATVAATTPPSAMASSSSTNLQPSQFYHVGQDLNLSFPTQTFPFADGGSLSALELLRSGISARGLGPFSPAPAPAAGALFGHGFGFQELMRPANLKLPLEGVGGGYNAGSLPEAEAGRLLFPFEDLKQVSASNGSDEAVDNGGVQQGQGDPSLFWNGGGSW